MAERAMRILVIDAEYHNLALVRQALKEHILVEASSAGDALKMIEAGPQIDAVLVVGTEAKVFIHILATIVGTHQELAGKVVLLSRDPNAKRFHKRTVSVPFDENMLRREFAALEP